MMLLPAPILCALLLGTTSRSVNDSRQKTKMSINVTLSVNGVERMEMLSVPRDADMRWLAHTVKEIAGVPEHLQRVSVVVSECI